MPANAESEAWLTCSYVHRPKTGPVSVTTSAVVGTSHWKSAECYYC